MNQYSYYILAAGYGCDAYGKTENYNTCASTAGSSGQSPGSTLVDTGITVAIFVAVATALIFVALVVRFWRTKDRQQTQETQDQANNTTTSID